jgi:hypothetical protein
MALFYERIKGLNDRHWLPVLLYAPHALYFLLFGVLTLLTRPLSGTVKHMSEVWSIPTESIALLFIFAGVALLIQRSRFTIAVAYFVQISYFAALVWVVNVNGTSPTAVAQAAVTTLSLVIMIDVATGLEQAHGIDTPGS